MRILGRIPKIGEKFALTDNLGIITEYEVTANKEEGYTVTPEDGYIFSISDSSPFKNAPMSKFVYFYSCEQTINVLDRLICEAESRYLIPIGIALSTSSFIRLCAWESKHKKLSHIKLLNEWKGLKLFHTGLESESRILFSENSINQTAAYYIDRNG